MTVYDKLQSLQDLPRKEQRQALNQHYEKLFEIGLYSVQVCLLGKQKFHVYLRKTIKYPHLDYLENIALIMYDDLDFPKVTLYELPHPALHTAYYLAQVFDIMQSEVE